MAILDNVYISEWDIVDAVKQSMIANESVQLHQDVFVSVVNTLSNMNLKTYDDLHIEAQVVVDNHTDEDGNLYLPSGHIEPKDLPEDW